MATLQLRCRISDEEADEEEEEREERCSIRFLICSLVFLHLMIEAAVGSVEEGVSIRFGLVDGESG